MIKGCKYCGKEFQPDKFHPKQIYCSNRCSTLYWNNQYRKDHLEKRECKICGDKFQPIKDRHYYCSKRCRKIAYYRSPKGKIQAKNSLKRVMHKYRTNKKYRDRWVEKNHRYAISEKGKNNNDVYRKKYRKTENGKRADLKYRKSDKRNVSLNKYTKSEKGRSNLLKHSLKRREKLNDISHNFTEEEWLQKVKNTFGVCPRCDRYIGIPKLSLDHIMPISKVERGKVYTIDEVQPLCRSCNSSKNCKVEV